jgi:uncharacterized membrane protein YfcA
LTIFDFLLLLLLAFAIELVNASLGMGWGTIFTPVLILMGFPAIIAVPAVLLSQGLGSITASIFHTKFENASFVPGSIELKTAAIVGGFGVVASLFAVLLAVNIDKIVLNTYIGAIVLAMGIFILVNRRFKFSWKRIIGVGLLSAFNKGISGGGFGPIVTGGQIMAGQEQKKAIAITLFSEIPICLVGFFTYLIARAAKDVAGSVFDQPAAIFLANMFSPKIFAWDLCLALTAGAFIAAPFGALATKVLRNELVRKLVGVLIVILGGWTLIRTYS